MVWQLPVTVLLVPVVLAGCVTKSSPPETLLKKPAEQIALEKPDGVRSLSATAHSERCTAAMAAIATFHSHYTMGVNLAQNTCTAERDGLYRLDTEFERKGSKLPLRFILVHEEKDVEPGLHKSGFSVNAEKIDGNGVAQTWSPEKEEHLLHVNMFHVVKTLTSWFADKPIKSQAYCEHFGRNYSAKEQDCVYPNPANMIKEFEDSDSKTAIGAVKDFTTWFTKTHLQPLPAPEFTEKQDMLLNITFTRNGQKAVFDVTMQYEMVDDPVDALFAQYAGKKGQGKDKGKPKLQQRKFKGGAIRATFAKHREGDLYILTPNLVHFELTLKAFLDHYAQTVDD